MRLIFCRWTNRCSPTSPTTEVTPSDYKRRVILRVSPCRQFFTSPPPSLSLPLTQSLLRSLLFSSVLYSTLAAGPLNAIMRYEGVTFFGLLSQFKLATVPHRSGPRRRALASAHHQFSASSFLSGRMTGANDLHAEVSHYIHQLVLL